MTDQTSIDDEVGPALAIFSPCRTWRYSLTRHLGSLTGIGDCVFVGLNPSTADETADDPTIRRCVRFARDWGYASLTMLNLYGYRATDPRVMRAAPDPVGPHNDDIIRHRLDRAQLRVAAWGVNPDRARSDHIAALTDFWVCLGLTNGGYPRHPLYVPSKTQPIPYLHSPPVRVSYDL